MELTVHRSKVLPLGRIKLVPVIKGIPEMNSD